MEISIYLNNGMKFNADVDSWNASEYAVKLNSNQVQVLNIGGVVISKHVVTLVAPSTVSKDSVGDVTIYTTNGDSYNVEAPDYDSNILSNDINNAMNTLVPIGNALINKQVFMMALPKAI